jgi:uncharacterized protein with HEPN domain
MSKRNWIILLEDILSSIEKIENYTKNLQYEDFINNSMIMDATVRNIEIIGEISKQFPEKIKNTIPEIPWKSISGIRNRIIHEYFNVDVSIIWQIIINDLPKLKTTIAKKLEENPNLGF